MPGKGKTDVAQDAFPVYKCEGALEWQTCGGSQEVSWQSKGIQGEGPRIFRHGTCMSVREQSEGAGGNDALRIKVEPSVECHRWSLGGGGGGGGGGERGGV